VRIDYFPTPVSIPTWSPRSVKRPSGHSRALPRRSTPRSPQTWPRSGAWDGKRTIHRRAHAAMARQTNRVPRSSKYGLQTRRRRKAN